MLGSHVFIYISSRVFAAALNLASVALFARLAGPSSYGEYLIIFAWAYIIYGFSVQWLRFAFFASYQEAAADRQIATFTQTAGHIVLAVVAAALVYGVLGSLSWELLLGVIALVVGLTVYDGVVEIGRTRLEAKSVGLAVILRAVTMMIFGCGALLLFRSPAALAVGVAIAHVCAVLPLLVDLLPRMRTRWSWDTTKGYFAYGWPLVFAFGVTSLGQNIDRLMLASFVGVNIVGPYGAVGDLIKQCIIVMGEAVAGAYVSIAKNASVNGDDELARDILSKAFSAFAAIGLFGAAFILRFEGVVVEALLGPAFSGPTQDLAPLFVAASVVMLFRSFYFGQVIYFSGSSMMELAAATATVVVIGLLGLILIPTYGAYGAAVAFLCGQIAACAICFFWGRQLFQMPVPLHSLLRLSACAIAGYALTVAVGWLPLAKWSMLTLQFMILLGAFIAGARELELFAVFRDLIGSWRRREFKLS